MHTQKNLLKRAVMVLVITAMLMACLPCALAETYFAELDLTKSTFAESISYSDPDRCELFFTIGAKAPAHAVIDIADAVFRVCPEGYTVMPGDKLEIKVHVTNNGKSEYRYMDKSFMISTGNHEGMFLTDFVGADGKQLPLSHISAISPSIHAIRALYGKSHLKASEIFALYDQLAAKGYTGKNALCNYMLDYYNDAFSTSYATFDELIASDKRRDIGRLFADPGSDSLFTVTISEVEALCKAHPELDPYVMLFDIGSSDTYYMQIKWPEEALAAFSYDFFYEDIFCAAYGEEAGPAFNPNSGVAVTRERGIYDYADKSGAAYTAANDFFKTAYPELGVGGTGDFDMVLTLDGPWMGNGYASYDISFTNTITMERIGSVPETGDHANIVLWSVMACASAAVIALMVFGKKKKSC